MNATRRSDTQDIAKGISIFAVVLVHTWRGLISVGVFTEDHFLNFVDKAGLLFGLPLFFVLAGYNTYFSLQRSSPRDFIIKRAKTIIPIYIVWSLLQSAVHVLKHDGGVADLWGGLGKTLLGMTYSPIDQFWFLYALLAFHIVAALLRKYPYVLLGIGAAMYCCYPFVPLFGQDLCCSFIFYVLGYIAGPRKLPTREQLHLNISLPVTGALYVASAWFVNAYHIDPRMPFLFPLVCVSVAFFFLLSYSLDKTKIGSAWAVVGIGSLAIYVMHVLFFAGWRFVLFKLGVTDGYVHLISETLVGVLGPLAFFLLLKRYKLTRYAFLG